MESDINEVKRRCEEEREEVSSSVKQQCYILMTLYSITGLTIGM